MSWRERGVGWFFLAGVAVIDLGCAHDTALRRAPLVASAGAVGAAPADSRTETADAASTLGQGSLDPCGRCMVTACEHDVAECPLGSLCGEFLSCVVEVDCEPGNEWCFATNPRCQPLYSELNYQRVASVLQCGAERCPECLGAGTD